MKKTNLILLLAIFLGMSTWSCIDDDANAENMGTEGLITDVTYSLSSADGYEATFSFIDRDGDGGNDALIFSDTLLANKTYTGGLILHNRSTSPIERISQEIAREGLDHQVFFISTIEGLTVAYRDFGSDFDTDGNPIGFVTELTTGDPGIGTLTMTLRSGPDKFAEGVSDGDITNAGGETVIEVIFDVVLE